MRQKPRHPFPRSDSILIRSCRFSRLLFLLNSNVLFLPNENQLNRWVQQGSLRYRPAFSIPGCSPGLMSHQGRTHVKTDLLLDVLLDAHPNRPTLAYPYICERNQENIRSDCQYGTFLKSHGRMPSLRQHQSLALVPTRCPQISMPQRNRV